MKLSSTSFKILSILGVVQVALVRADERSWTADDLIRAVAAREQSIRSVDARIEHVSFDPYKDKALMEARYAGYRAAEQLEGRLGSVMSFESFKKREGEREMIPPTRVRYVRDADGRNRTEFLTPKPRGKQGEFDATGITVDDGQRLYNLRGHRGTITNPSDRSRLGYVFGLEFTWNERGLTDPEAHTLSGALREILKAGLLRVEPGTGDGLVNAVITQTPGDPRFQALYLLRYTLGFDPKLGMALVDVEKRLVRKKKDKDGSDRPFPDAYYVSHWKDFREDDPGVWLPRRRIDKAFTAVVLPKDGEFYPPGIDQSRLDPKYVRAPSS